MKQTLKYYSINDIRNWNQAEGRNDVTLPKMQRGFVWKPLQMANLWDSIFRGFPIGSFLVARGENGQVISELLDGQQRSTTIKAGFYNPFKEENNGAFSLSKFPSIWIDLKPKEIPKNSKFCIHIVTESHPWGFKANSQSDRISLNYRRGYLDYVRSKIDFSNYLKIDPKYYIPWDSVFPIPISLITQLIDNDEVNDVESFKSKFIKIIRSSNIVISTKYSSNLCYETDLDDSDFSNLYSVLENIRSLVIPELIVDIKDVNLEGEQQDPTLFVRLNSGGTPINGEELVYSIFKAKFPELKNLVENIAADYIAPSKLINLYARLVLAKIDIESKNVLSYHRMINLKAFNRHVANEEFKEKLTTLIKNSAKKDHEFQLCKDLFLEHFKLNPIPVVLIKELIKDNLDLFYTLLVYLDISRIKTIQDISKDHQKEIIRIIFQIAWFSSDKPKATKKLFQILCTNGDNETFDYQSATSKLAKDKLIYPILEADALKQLFDNSIDNNWAIEDDRNIDFLKKCSAVINYYPLEQEQDFLFFKGYINQIKWNRNLLLLAQKEYIINEFQEFNQFFSLDDTNRPWDWDHIFPHSWAYNKKNIHHLVRHYLNSVGNYRALSAAKNRSENDHISPKERLLETNIMTDSFVDQEDYENYWCKFDQSDLRITAHNVDTDLLQAYQKAVLYRMYRIYQHFYNLIFI